MKKRTAQFTVLAVSSLFAATFGWLAYSRIHAAETVVMVDTGEEVERVLRRGAAPVAAGTEARLPHGPIPEADAAVLFPQIVQQQKLVAYDPQTHFWERAHAQVPVTFPEHPDGKWEVRTNDRGFRTLEDVATTRPDLRVLVSGDSHTAAVVPLPESFANVSATMLRQALPGRTVEVLNGGKGGFSFYNYIGTLEKHLDLAPDVFVLAVYGGNDFIEGLKMHRYYRHLGPMAPASKEWTRRFNQLRDGRTKFLAQYGWQVLKFVDDQATQDLAVEAATAVTAEIARICAGSHIRLICVYIPPVADVQPERIREDLDAMQRIMGCDRDDLDVTQRVARRYLRFLQDADIQAIDMTEPFAAVSEPLYWQSDYHLNTAGHRLVAQHLAAAINGA